MQEIILKALERDPDQRYARAREFAADLAQPENVKFIDRSERVKAKPKPTSRIRRALNYAMLAMIPVVLLTLLLLVARLK
jgi:hypothetical protein